MYREGVRHSKIIGAPSGEVFTLPLVFHMDLRGMVQIPLIPGHQFFGLFGFTIPHGMMRNLDPFHVDPWNLLGLFHAH